MMAMLQVDTSQCPTARREYTSGGCSVFCPHFSVCPLGASRSRLEISGALVHDHMAVPERMP